ncbi:hypothetical protein OROGR_005517 [Orobanche gracilis]
MSSSRGKRPSQENEFNPCDETYYFDQPVYDYSSSQWPLIPDENSFENPPHISSFGNSATADALTNITQVLYDESDDFHDQIPQPHYSAESEWFQTYEESVMVDALTNVIRGVELSDSHDQIPQSQPTEEQGGNNSATTSKKKYVGVWKKLSGYAAAIQNNGKREWLGSFKSPEEAALAYDQAAIRYRGPQTGLNFPQVPIASQTNFGDNNHPIDDTVSLTHKRGKKEATSIYVGVRRRKWEDAYAVEIGHKGKKKWIGTFKTEEEAAVAYDEAALRLRGPKAKLNFPDRVQTGSQSNFEDTDAPISNFCDMVPLTHDQTPDEECNYAGPYANLEWTDPNNEHHFDKHDDQFDSEYPYNYYDEN